MLEWGGPWLLRIWMVGQAGSNRSQTCERGSATAQPTPIRRADHPDAGAPAFRNTHVIGLIRTNLLPDRVAFETAAPRSPTIGVQSRRWWESVRIKNHEADGNGAFCPTLSLAFSTRG